MPFDYLGFDHAAGNLREAPHIPHFDRYLRAPAAALQGNAIRLGPARSSHLFVLEARPRLDTVR